MLPFGGIGAAIAQIKLDPGEYHISFTGIYDTGTHFRGKNADISLSPLGSFCSGKVGQGSQGRD